MLSLGFIGVIFTLIFRQFSQQRSRVLGYATFYGALFSTMPLAQILDAYVFSYYDFNVIFLIKIFMVIPGFLLLLIILKRKCSICFNRMSNIQNSKSDIEQEAEESQETA